MGARIKAPCYPAPPRPPGMVASDVSYRYVSRATSHAQLTRQLAVMLSLSLARTPRLGSSISPDARDVCPTPRPCGDVFHLPGCAVWLIIVDSCTVRSPVAHVCLSATVTVTGWCVALTLAPCGDHELAFERHDWGGVAVFWLDCKSLQSGDPDNVACGFFVGETKQERRIQKQRVRRKARYARKLD